MNYIKKILLIAKIFTPNKNIELKEFFMTTLITSLTKQNPNIAKIEAHITVAILDEVFEQVLEYAEGKQ